MNKLNSETLDVYGKSRMHLHFLLFNPEVTYEGLETCEPVAKAINEPLTFAPYLIVRSS